MGKTVFECQTESPNVILRVRGDLSLSGIDEMQIYLEGSTAESGTVNQDGDIYTIETPEGCVIEVPKKARVVVDKVNGDAQIKNLDQDLVVDKIGGDLYLEQVCTVTIDKVGGDLTIQDGSGVFVVRKVGGNLVVSGAVLGVSAERIGGDFCFTGEGGNININTGGDAHLVFTRLYLGTVDVFAGGDLWCQVPDDAGVVAYLKSGSQEIRLYMPDGVRLMEKAVHEYRYGEPESTLTLKAGGEVYFGGSKMQEEIEDVIPEIEHEWDALETIIERSIEAGMAAANVGIDIAERISREMERHGPMMGQRIAERAAAAAERAAARAQAAAERAATRMEAAGARAEARMQMNMRRGTTSGYGPIPGRRAASEPVTESERLMVLKMLQDHVITMEEAERLLAALDAQDNKY